MKLNPTKRQHKISQFLLAEFTLTRDKRNGVLHVADLETGKWRRSAPKNEEFENEFYTADFGPDMDPRGIETAFSTLEGKWAPIVQALNSGLPLPNPPDESVADLFQFAATQAIRTAESKKAFLKLSDDDWHRELTSQVRELDQWATVADTVTDSHLSFLDQRRSSLQVKKSEAQASKAWIIEQLIWSGIVMGVHLTQTRKWSVWRIGPEDGVFAGSDRMLTFATLEPLAFGWPLYRDPQAIVVLPIGSYVAMVGTSEYFLPLDDPKNNVALVNLTTTANAKRVFAARQDFPILMPDERVAPFTEWLEEYTNRLRD